MQLLMRSLKLIHVNFSSLVFISFIAGLAFSCNTRKKRSANSDSHHHSKDSLLGVIPDSNPNGRSDSSEIHIITMAELYSRTCGNCHQLYTPENYSDVEWKTNLNKMQVRAMVSDDAKEALYTYLTTRNKE